MQVRFSSWSSFDCCWSDTSSLLLLGLSICPLASSIVLVLEWFVAMKSSTLTDISSDSASDELLMELGLPNWVLLVSFEQHSRLGFFVVSEKLIGLFSAEPKFSWLLQIGFGLCLLRLRGGSSSTAEFASQSKVFVSNLCAKCLLDSRFNSKLALDFWLELIFGLWLIMKLAASSQSYWEFKCCVGGCWNQLVWCTPFAACCWFIWESPPLLLLNCACLIKLAAAIASAVAWSWLVWSQQLIGSWCCILILLILYQWKNNTAQVHSIGFIPDWTVNLTSVKHNLNSIRNDLQASS